MKKIDFGQSLAILANIGVIAGILFLALELRQSNRIAIASTELAIRDSYGAFNEILLTDPGVRELLLKIRDPNPSLTPDDEIQVRAYLRRLLNTWIAIEVAYDNELLSADTYALVEQEPQGILSAYPGAKPSMRMVVDEAPGQDSRRVIRSIEALLE